MVKIYIYFGYVPKGQWVKNESVRPLFEAYGTVTHCEVIKNYGFVLMASESAATAAINKLNNQEVQGLKMKVELNEKMGKMKRIQDEFRRSKPKKTIKLFVKNIADGTTDQELTAVFVPYGEVIEVAIVSERNYGFVHMDADLGQARVKEIISILNGFGLNGAKLSVNLSNREDQELKQTTGEELRCYKCGETGHLVREYRSRRFGDGGFSIRECSGGDSELQKDYSNIKKTQRNHNNSTDKSDSYKTDNQNNLMKILLDQLECPVCLEVPRSGPVPVCPNGHFVCKMCKINFMDCPTCKTAMGSGRSLLAATILENVERRCCYDDCYEQFLLKDIANHEEICLHRDIDCPDTSCHKKIPLIKLVDHLHMSGHSEEKKPLETNQAWNRINYTITVDLSVRDMTWNMHVYAYLGQVFAVFPSKSDGQFFFVLVMFTSESKCSDYKFEMVVHDRESEASDSERAVKFQGTPLSIDGNKEDLNLYGSSDKLMTKILKNKSMSKVHAFSLSFKISKRI